MTDSRAIALAFAGMLTTGFAGLMALLASNGAPAFIFFIAAVACALDFIGRLDFDIVSES